MTFTSMVVEQDRDVFLIQRGPKHYEVWRLHHQRAARLPSGRELPEGWRPPKTSEWGKSGWTYLTLAEAQLRLRFLRESSDHSRDAWEAWWPKFTKRRPG